ncbi:MAG: hypothetical protein IKY46_02625 [Clostridia bacterium]|nr:hypothetical protein [Clostridia bacterium]
MAKKERKFADDGWAIWIDGDDTSTVYINNWVNPKGKSYVDLALHIIGIKSSKALNVYIPFVVTEEDIEDVSLRFRDTKILQATFSAACIIDFMKNRCTSEVAYNGKTMDIVHISTLDYQLKELAHGTLITIDFDQLLPYIDNDEAYFIWRMPHKSLDEIFKPSVDMGKILNRLRDLITTPVISEKYGYSIRINESRLLPEEITRIGVFHRQKLKKAVITISIDENYELNDSNTYRIRRMENDLYSKYLPSDYNCEDVITYQWQQSRETNLNGHYNFYYNISANSISRSSMFLYLVLLLFIGIIGDLMAALIQWMITK